MNARLGIAAALVVFVGALAWWACHRGPRMVYTSKGYGGYVPAGSEEAARKPATPLTPAVVAYNTRRYKDAEAEAQRVIKSNSGSNNPTRRKVTR